MSEHIAAAAFRKQAAKGVPESKIQTEIMQFLDKHLPSSYRAHAVPNGGNRDARTGAIMKREGVRAGVPDITIIGAGGVCALIEVKTAKGTLSNSQVEYRDWCGANQVPYAVVRGLGDVEAALLDWGINLKGRLAA